jgi:hypothetical protein
MTGSQSHDLAAMKPYYEDDSVTIYHGDAREFVEVGGNVLLTDPPYGISGGRGGQAREHGKGKYLATAWDDTPEYIGAVVVPIIVSLLGSVARGAVTPGVANLALYPKPADMGAEGGVRLALERFLNTSYPNNGEGRTDRLVWMVPESAFGPLRVALASPEPDEEAR